MDRASLDHHPPKLQSRNSAWVSIMTPKDSGAPPPPPPLLVISRFLRCQNGGVKPMLDFSPLKGPPRPVESPLRVSCLADRLPFSRTRQKQVERQGCPPRSCGRRPQGQCLVSTFGRSSRPRRPVSPAPPPPPPPFFLPPTILCSVHFSSASATALGPAGLSPSQGAWRPSACPGVCLLRPRLLVTS